LRIVEKTFVASRYVPSLTGIRALAALLVLGLHTDQNLPAGVTAILPFLGRGYLGVDLFFVLSGFIITHVYLSSLAEPTASAIRIFLWHRLIRLYPVHVTVLAILVVLVYVARSTGVPFNHPEQWQAADLLWQLTLLHAWGVTANLGWNAPSWSISAEWFAYLLFPLLAPALIFVRERLAALLLAVAALAGAAAIFAIAQWDLNSWVGAPALVRVFGEFLCGAVALGQTARLASGSPPPRLPRSSGDMLGMAGFLLFLIGASSGLPDFGLVALLALTILGTATAQTVLTRLLGSTALVWLGEISYSIYMIHVPALLVLRRFWERAGFMHWPASAKAGAFAVTIGTIIALAAMLFYLVEQPARMRLRDRIGRLAPA